MKNNNLLIFIIIFSLILSFSGCADIRQNTPISKTGFYLDTVVSITLYEGSNFNGGKLNRDEGEDLINAAFLLIEDYESLFSNKIEGSDIYNINENLEKETEISNETYKLLELSIYYGDISNGAFDITIGRVLDLYDFNEETHSAPSSFDLEKAKETVDYRNIELFSRDDKKYCILHGNGKIDTGGIAKGYIADRLKEFFNEKGINEGIINLGGNVLTIGEKTDGTDYVIGIQKPFSENGEVITKINIKDGSVVTSGIYQRYFYDDEGMLYHHIIDKKTALPVNNDLYSVTVITEDSASGDAFSTILFLRGEINKPSYFTGEALFIDKDYKIIKTDDK